MYVNYNRPEPSVFLGSILILLVNPVLKPPTITSSSLVSATRKPSSVSVGGFQFKASTSSVASASNSSVQQEPACTNTKIGLDNIHHTIYLYKMKSHLLRPLLKESFIFVVNFSSFIFHQNKIMFI